MGQKPTTGKSATTEKKAGSRPGYKAVEIEQRATISPLDLVLALGKDSPRFVTLETIRPFAPAALAAPDLGYEFRALEYGAPSIATLTRKAATATARHHRFRRPRGRPRDG